MRFASFIRQLPRQPKLPNPTLTSHDVARALTEVLQNQAAIMNEIAQIKNTMIWLNGEIFGAMLEIQSTGEAGIFNRAVQVNARLTQALSD
jgi:hypothetical protein